MFVRNVSFINHEDCISEVAVLNVTDVTKLINK